MLSECVRADGLLSPVARQRIPHQRTSHSKGPPDNVPVPVIKEDSNIMFMPVSDLQITHKKDIVTAIKL